MKTLKNALALIALATLTGGAAAPDVIIPGTRILTKDMRVDPGTVGKTHFVFAIQGGELIELTAKKSIRCYHWETLVFAAPISQKAEVLAAFRPIPEVKVSDLKTARRVRGEFRKKRDERIRKLLDSLPRSKSLETRESVKVAHPVHKVEVRYTVTGIDSKKKTVTLDHRRTLYDSKGAVVTPKQVKESQDSVAMILLLTAGAGIAGLGVVSTRRSSSPAA